MEYRKLISFGKNSYVVSLPKTWVIQNKLKKGDLIYVDENTDNLVLKPQRDNKEDAEKQIVINVDGKSFFALRKEVCSAYIRNYSRIVLKGQQLRNKVKEVQGVVQSLIALEIMEQTSETIVAKDFLNMDTVSVNEIMRKMDIVTRTMLKELQSVFITEIAESLAERDKDVNRLYFLLYRAVLYNLENPLKAMKSFKLNSIDLMRIHFMGFHIEAIADEVRRIAKYSTRFSADKKKETEIRDFLNTMYTYYTETLKAIYSNNVDRALELSELKRQYLKQLNDYDAYVMTMPGFNRMLNRMRRMVNLINSLGRVFYTLY